MPWLKGSGAGDLVAAPQSIFKLHSDCNMGSPSALLCQDSLRLQDQAGPGL